MIPLPTDEKTPPIGSLLAAIAAGVSLAPTSVGIALKLLMEHGSLHFRYGQIIVAAAFLDDIFSLVAFQVLTSVSDKEVPVTFARTFQPGVLAVVFLVTGALLAVYMWPRVIHYVIDKVRDREGKSFQPRDNLLMLIMVGICVGYACLSQVSINSHLLGCFVSGMSLAEVKRAHHVWVNQTKRTTAWLMRMFFAGTIAFSVPVKSLFMLRALGFGAIMGLLACILTKLAAGLFLKDFKWVVGWAMCGRAEFAFLIAGMARANNVFYREEQYVIVIWALIWAVVAAPIMFSISLKRYNANRRRIALDADKLPADDTKRLSVIPIMRNARINIEKQLGQLYGQRAEFRVLVIRKMCHEDIDYDLHKFFHGQNLVVTSTASKSDDGNYMGVFGVRARNQDIDVEHLAHFRTNIFRLFNDNDARVVMLPASSHDGVENQMLKITVMSQSDPLLLTKLIRQIQLNGLTVVQTQCMLHHPVFVGGLTYYPHKGEYVIMCVAQVGPAELKSRAQTVSSFMATAQTQVKEAIRTAKLGCNEVLVEPLPYDPDPLRACIHANLEIDITDEWLLDEERCQVPTFFRVRVVVDNDPTMRVVGALQELVEKTSKVLDTNNFAVVLFRQDHLPLAPQPTIAAVVQWLGSQTSEQELTRRAFTVQEQLKHMLESCGVPGDAEVQLLTGHPRDWKGLSMSFHLDQETDDSCDNRGNTAQPSFVDVHISERVPGKLGAGSSTMGCSPSGAVARDADSTSVPSEMEASVVAGVVLTVDGARK